MTDQLDHLMRSMSHYAEGDAIGTSADITGYGTTKATARFAMRFLELVGVAKRGRHKKLYRTATPVPELGDLRLAPTHLYRITYSVEGKARLRHARVTASRSAKKLDRLIEAPEVTIIEVQEAWQTPWTRADASRDILRMQSARTR